MTPPPSLMTRRVALGGGIAAVGAAAVARGLLVSDGNIAVGPEAFGAKGDGLSDDTAALQAWIEAAGESARLALRPHATYLINTNWRPTFGQYGGLKLRHGQTLELNDAELHALPSPHREGAVLQGYKTNGWRVLGPGAIVGDRPVHTGKGGEWGMGIAAWSASEWQVKDVTISQCWGDGIMVGYAPDAIGSFCENFAIERGRISFCRRNGISIVAGRRGRIENTIIRSIAGTSPQAGIDLEPDSGVHPNEHIVIVGVDIADADLGIAVMIANHTTTITRSRVDAGNSGVMIGDGAKDLTIADNMMIHSRLGGAEGGAIRTAAGDNTSIEGVVIRNNDLSGGGFFVIDFAAGARRVSVTGNRIVASNPRSRVARLFSDSTFTANEGVVTAAAGAEDSFIVQLVGTRTSSNRYRNLSPFKMPPLLVPPR